MNTKYDARAVANLILTEAWSRNISCTNLQLQKLAFLSHALLIVEQGRDLIARDFVAWKYGPVHNDIYDAFKAFREKPITRLAVGFNPVTEQTFEIPCLTESAICDVVRRIIAFYGTWTAAELVSLTHAKNGPWDVVVRSAEHNANLGLRISRPTIERHYKYLWFGKKSILENEPLHEEPPFAT